jgi:Ni/Co efflux regulator RcnB
MKKINLIRVALVAALCLSQGGAWAESGRGNGRGNGHGDDRGSDCGPGNSRCSPGHNKDYGRNDGARNHDGERGAGPDRAYYRGDRLPYGYRGPQYVVEDWRGHGLRTPPRGYHWVQTGGDYVLVAITTGIILELLLNH